MKNPLGFHLSPHFELFGESDKAIRENQIGFGPPPFMDNASPKKFFHAPRRFLIRLYYLIAEYVNISKLRFRFGSEMCHKSANPESRRIGA
jgi:hypothetical protein